MRARKSSLTNGVAPACAALAFQLRSVAFGTLYFAATAAGDSPASSSARHAFLTSSLYSRRCRSLTVKPRNPLQHVAASSQSRSKRPESPKKPLPAPCHRETRALCPHPLRTNATPLHADDADEPLTVTVLYGVETASRNPEVTLPPDPPAPDRRLVAPRPASANGARAVTSTPQPGHRLRIGQRIPLTNCRP